MNDGYFFPLSIFRCCRDWPVIALFPMGRCGECGEVPVFTQKSLTAYLQERE